MTKNQKQLSKARGIFFDLDGTLLQVDMQEFIPAYLKKLAICFKDIVDHHTFADNLLKTTLTLLHRNNGGPTNEDVFMAKIEQKMGIDRVLFNKRLQTFCQNGLQSLSPLIRPLPIARNILKRCFAQDLKVVLATNPVFPRPIVEARLQWGHLSDFPYHLVTSYENSSYCKPHPHYFRGILENLDLSAEECIMVGNDTVHDLGASRIGITTFLVDTWLVDRGDRFTPDFRGGHMDLYHFVGQLGDSRQLPANHRRQLT